MRTSGAWRQILVSLAVSLAIWVLFSWPLPKYMASGISSSSLNVEKGSVRVMIPGDHLQFLSQFWLAEDTLRGRTRLFHNPYEFNAGNDADRTFYGAYYAPFSLFYIAGSLIGGPAFGYNFDQIVTLWLTFLFTWLLVGRFCRDVWQSAAAAVIGIIFPYLWITTLDGSPTGLAMMWIPVIFWSLDIMVADRKPWAGAVAGVGICLAEADTHVFFFAIMATPFWCLFSFLFHFPGRWPSRADARAILKASTFLIILLGVACLQAWYIRQGIQHTLMAATGRSLSEIAANSPQLAGVFRFENTGEDRRIYMGVYLIVLLLAGLGAFLWTQWREKEPPATPVFPVLLLCLGIGGVVLLSTGVNNPGGPMAWMRLSKLIPPYAMIRQPHKIYCLMPVLLALAAGILWPCLFQSLSQRWRKVVAVVLLVPLMLEYNHRIRPTICLLQKEQGVFRAIAEDARASGNPRPHLLSLPLWPGNSHYDSVNEYYVSLYHLRMMNGYGAGVKNWFRNDIFLPFESLNVGGVSDSQLNALQKRGVEYLVLHEDCFPEKVSPFPVGYTLQALLNHPRLTCIGKDGSLWAFKIRPADQAEVSREKEAFMKYGFPAKCSEFERSAMSATAKRGNDPSAMGDAYVRLACTSATVRVSETLAVMDEPLSWMVRLRGRGVIAVSIIEDGATNTPVRVEVASNAWNVAGHTDST